MDRSNGIPPSNTTQISYPVTNEDGKKTIVSSSHRMPLIRLPARSPLFSPGPRSTMFQSSHVFSPFPPLTPSSSSLFCDSPLAPVENIDSSIGFNNNLSLPPMMSHPTGFNNNHILRQVSPSRPLVSPSIGFNINSSWPLMSPSTGLNNNPSLPPMMPSMRSNPLRVSDNNLLPGKANKWSKSDIIGINLMISPNSLELNDPKPLEGLIMEPHKGKEAVSEMQSDEEFEKEFNAYKNLNFSAFNFNENEAEIYINISDFEDENSVIESGSKNGSASSCVKRRAVQKYDPLSKHSSSISLDSCCNNNLKKPHLPPVNLTGKVSSTNSVHGNDIDGSDYKRVRRILANRESAERSNEKKKQHFSHLKHKIMALEIKKYTLSTELAFVKKNNMALMSENKYLTIQLESKKQQAKLGEAMNKQLNAEVKRLKAATSLNQQLSAQIQQLDMAKAVNEQLSEEVQQLNVTTCEMMQTPIEFEISNMQPPN